ncbi:MAG: ZIP family metal transporter [Candidatus Omnitrophica bacterium]|nr:ZIP family metal transporter [Candidatus Omnitrophota bacterium]
MIFTLLQNGVALVSAALGASLAVLIGVSHKHLCALISFAAGTLFATTFFHIVPEAAEILPLGAVFLALVSGYLLFHLISRFFFHVCPACAASHFDEQTASRFRSIALLLVIALGFHCVMDGIAIALGGSLERRTDWSIFLAVTVHKFPEGLALSALMRRGGYDRARSFFSTVAIETLTVFGWLLGQVLLTGSPETPVFYLTLAHVGGGFIYLALHAVLNESKEHSPRYVFFFFLFGVAFISLTNLIPL